MSRTFLLRVCLAPRWSLVSRHIWTHPVFAWVHMVACFRPIRCVQCRARVTVVFVLDISERIHGITLS